MNRAARSWNWSFALAVCCAAACNGKGSNNGGNNPGGGVDTSMWEARPTLHPPATLGPGFVDLTAPILAVTKTVLAPLVRNEGPEQTSGLWADLDGSGIDDLILAHTDVHDVDSSETDPTPGDEIYRYDPTAKQFALDARYTLDPTWIVGAALDLDDDGQADLLLHRPALNVVWDVAQGPAGTPARIDGLGVEAPPATETIHSACLDDIDGDGWLDLLFSDGPGHIFPMLRTGARTFAKRDDLITLSALANPYTVYSSTTATGDKMLLAVGEPLPAVPGESVFYHDSGLDPNGFPLFVPFDPVPANAYFLDNGDFTDLGAAAPMSVAGADLDGDGLVDFTVSLDPVHAMFRGQSTWPFIDRTRATWYGVIASDLGLDMIPWGVALVDIDMDGRPDAFAVHGNDDGAWWDPSDHIGPQYVTLEWNGGNFNFADITPLSHLDRRGQYRALSLADFDGDGDVDFVVGGQFEMPRVYRNDVDAGNHGFTLRLHGTSSNSMGIGAHVAVTVAGQAPRPYVMTPTASPYAVSEPLLAIGLGSATTADNVEITWPSGTVQNVAGLAAGKLQRVDEPPAWTIDPPTRHIPADGKSLVTLHVTPRSLDGTVRAGAVVQVTVTHGAATIMGAPVLEASGGFAVSILAPSQPGSARLEIHVDGATLPLHPRVWFD